MTSFRPVLASRRRAWLLLAVVALIVGGAAVIYVVVSGAGPSAPSATGQTVCGRPSLNGPSSPPPGSVVIPAGDDHTRLAIGIAGELKPDTTYYFASGVHTIGAKRRSQIEAGTGDTLIGAPGAVLNGQGVNQFAVTGNPFRHTARVTIEYLTIEDFAPPGNNGAVGANSYSGWTLSHDTIRDNYPGAGAIVGTDSTLQANCLTDNGQYGFQAESGFDRSDLTRGPMNVTVVGNEISDNDACNWGHAANFPITPPSRCHFPMRGSGTSCGCSGGAKFWKVEGAVVRGNYIHDNYAAGLWADTNDDGFVVSDNVFTHNRGIAWDYEVSYNLLLEDNVFSDNGWGPGPLHRAFPEPAVYISESGGSAAVPNPEGITTITISNNHFVDNWSGVILWENADRFCGSTAQPTDGCTLVDPSVANRSTCTEANLDPAGVSGRASGDAAPQSGRPDYWALCRWRTEDVTVTGNTFVLDPSVVPQCEEASNSCGMNGVFANWGSEPKWSPYKGKQVAIDITTGQGNSFDHNTYVGPWSFDYLFQKTGLSPIAWQARGEDVHSSFRRA